MKNLKKVLALVLACATLFTMSTFAFSDVAEDASYLEAVTMLSKLGIINGYEDGSFLPDNTITRAEAAKVLVCALNAEESALGMADQELFTDVPASHWAAGYVNYAANFGIIAGRGNGIFDPESPVSYEEIVKMVVAMLGYTPVANIKGGYPTGYLYVANSVAKITKGATGTTGDAAKRWVVARLVFNSLETKIMEPEKWSASDPEYIKGEDTLLKDYLEVTKLEGVVTDSFLSKKDIDKDNENIEITVTTIDGKTFRALEDEGISYTIDADAPEYTVEANGTGAEDYLGYTVVAYVQDFDEGSDKLVAIAPKANKNSTLTVAFDDFEKNSAGEKSSYVAFEYYANVDDDDTTIGKVSMKNDVFKAENGLLEEAPMNVDGSGDRNNADIVALINKYSTDYTDEEGFIKFVDNNGDGYYEYIFIDTVSDEYVVESVDSKKFKIEDKITNKAITLDPTDDETYVNFYKGGVQVEFDAIEEGDTLSVVLNDASVKKSSVVKVYISSDKVEGYVSTASDPLDGGKNEFKIDGTVYAKSAKNTNRISRSDDGTFYLNYNGRIAYAEAEKSAEGSYAFLLSVNTDEDFSDGTTYTLRFMNEKGEWVDAALYEKLAIYNADGTQKKKFKNIEAMQESDALKSATESWIMIGTDGLEMDVAYEQRIFKYALNSNGDITKITLPGSTLNEDDFSYDEFSGAVYKESKNSFTGIDFKGGVDKNTVVFTIDNDKELNEITKKKEVSLSSNALFKDEGKYDGFAYDFDGDNYECMVITSGSNVIDPEDSLLVITSVEYTVGDDYDYYVITGYKDGEEVTLEATEDVDIDGLEDDESFEDIDGGAIAEISLDSAGKVDNIDVLFLIGDAVYGDGKVLKDDDQEMDEEDVYVYGSIVSKKTTGTGKYIELAEKANFDEEGYFVEGTTLADIATAGAGMKGNIYVVEKGARKTKVSVDTSIADYVGSFETEPEAGNDIYFAYAKLYDGDTIDIVVYEIEYPEVEGE